MKQATSLDDGLQGTESRVDWIGRLPFALLGAAMVASTWLILDLNAPLTFLADEWDPLLNRRGWGFDQIFAPFNGHPTMVPILIYKVVQELFGMDSARPVQIIHAVGLLIMNGLLFVYLRRRVGDWAALIGTVMILFLGAAFEILIFSFTINFTGAIAAGIGALVALDRDDRKGDLTAAILLVIGACFSMVILPFVAAAAVEWILNPRDRKARLIIPGGVILVLFFWWVIWGRESESNSLILSNIPALPIRIFDGLSSGFTSLFGLATGDGSEPEQPNLIWGRLMAIAAVALSAWRLEALKKPPREFLVVGTALLAYLVILGMSFSEGRQPTFSRYQLLTAILILMTASTLLRGVKIRPASLAVAALVALLAVQGGVRLMEGEARGQWFSASQYIRSYLTGVELSGRDASTAETVTGLTWVTISGAEYLEVVEEHGSPAFDRWELTSQGPNELTWIDQGLVAGTASGLDANPPLSPESSCRRANAGNPIEVKPGEYKVENGTDQEITVLGARLGPVPGVRMGAVLPRSRAGLPLPRGSTNAYWRISFDPADGRVRLCGP